MAEDRAIPTSPLPTTGRGEVDLQCEVVRLREALLAAKHGLMNVTAVSHMCMECRSYETAHATLQEFNGFDEYFTDDSAKKEK